MAFAVRAPTGMAGVLRQRRAMEDVGHRVRHVARQRLYSRARLDYDPERYEWAFRVEHAGERRQLVVAGAVVDSHGDEVAQRLADDALELLDYLDGLRQGMRDLIDQ